MNSVLKVVVSLSVSGSLLILLLFISKVFLKNRTSRRWQYYIWLVAIARLLLPLTPEVSVVGTLFQQVEQTILQSEPTPDPAPVIYTNPASGLTHEPIGSVQPNLGNDLPIVPSLSIGKIVTVMVQYLWLVWLGVALILLIRRITAYQGFVKYMKAGCTEVSNVELLDKLAQIGVQTGVKRPVELLTNNLISSPLLFGFVHPCIVFPTVDLPEADFEYTIRHELTHYRQRDMFYKWLIQLTICVHWFNPLVWWMGREINRACELACDEAVIKLLDESGRRAYGDTLLHAMGTGGNYKNSLASVTLNESAELLKERLGAIMRYKKASKLTVVLSLVLAGTLTMGAAAAGAYPGPTKASVELSVKKGTHNVQKTAGNSPANQAEQYYEAGSLPLFQIVFSRLSEKERAAWLERLYVDGDFAFFSVAVGTLNENDPLIAAFAEKAYGDGEIAIFSTLTDRMDETELELWLDRALEDDCWDFQSMLFDKLEMDDEKDTQEKKWAEQQMAEYRAAGITMDGKDYYYQGELVNIFLDIRPNKSFYALDINPAGTVNIKIIRNENGQITGVTYMTEVETKELLDDMCDSDENWDDNSEISIPVNIPKVKSGEYVWLGTYTLAEGDRVFYNVSAESGKQLDVGFAKPGQTKPDIRYNMISNRRTDERLEVKSGAMVWKDPVKPGAYSLFVHTEGGTVTNVKGYITIIKALEN